MKTLLKLLPMLILTVLVAGCTSQSGTHTQTTYSSGNQTLYLPPNGTVSMQIIEPTNGATINSTVVTIRVNVTNFRLADITANPVNRPNEGHIRYYLDDRYQTTVYQIVSFTQVANGTHIVRAELMNNDDTPLSTPVAKIVTITTQ